MAFVFAFAAPQAHGDTNDLVALATQFGRDGNGANRARFLLEIVDATVAAIGAGHVGVRVSPFNPFNDLEANYEGEREQFLALVAERRKSTPEKINEVAQGRVWTGQQARAAGLIDGIGGLHEAIARAAARAQL